MKKANYLFRVIVIVFVSFTLIFTFCKKDDNDETPQNHLPTVLIVSPGNGALLIQGDDVIISAEANDSDGSISEVRFYVDDIGKGTANSFPYTYTWNTAGENTGNHVLKATAYDNTGATKSDEINVTMYPTNSVIDIDENVYETVQIGSQVWMAENLKTTKYNNGDEIPIVSSETDWVNLMAGGCCYYDNNSANNDIYGMLYNWFALETGNLCPSGWHIPGDSEWKQLEMHLGMSQSEADIMDQWRGTNEGSKLKATSGWNFNGNGTDESGFSALPGGQRSYTDGVYLLLGDFGYFWTYTVHNNDESIIRALDYSLDKVGRFNFDKKVGLSVRCVKD